MREISVEVTLLRDNWADLRSAVRGIAAWLFTEDDAMLTFSDEPDKYYMARLTGDTDLNELLYTGETTLHFVCADPFAYAVTEKNKYQDPVRNVNLIANGDLSNDANYDTWLPYNADSQREKRTNVDLNGELINFMRIRTPVGVAEGVNFGLYSDLPFSATAGNTYTLSMLVGIQSNAMPELYYTYLLTTSNSIDQNQRITTTGDVITNHEYVGKLGSDNFNLDIYRYKLTFTAAYTDAQTKLLIGGRTAKDLTGTNSYGVIYVSKIKLEEGGVYTPFNYEPTLFQNLGTTKVYPRILVVPKVAGQTYFKITKGTESIIVYGDLSGGVFGVSDTFMIDCEANLVYDYSTGERMMTLVDISSDFFALDVGDNYLLSDSEAGFQYRVYWRERWL